MTPDHADLLAEATAIADRLAEGYRADARTVDVIRALCGALDECVAALRTSAAKRVCSGEPTSREIATAALRKIGAKHD